MQLSIMPTMKLDINEMNRIKDKQFLSHMALDKCLVEPYIDIKINLQ